MQLSQYNSLISIRHRRAYSGLGPWTRGTQDADWDCGILKYFDLSLWHEIEIEIQRKDKEILLERKFGIVVNVANRWDDGNNE